MTDSVTEPLKPIWATSYFRLFLAAALLAPLWLVGTVWLCNRVLPTEDAVAIKGPLLNALSAAAAAVVGGGGLATLAGGLMRTAGKVSTQKHQAIGANEGAANELMSVAVSQAVSNSLSSRFSTAPDAPSAFAAAPFVDALGDGFPDSEGDGPQDDEAPPALEEVGTDV